MSDSDKVNASLGIYGGFAKETGLDAGIDRFEHMQEPDFVPVDDLTRFVKARIIEAELEPRSEVMALYDEPGGAMAHRYAKYVRADMVVFRRIVAEYLTLQKELAKAVSPSSQRLLSGCVLTATVMLQMVACRWSGHRDFDQAWSIE